MKSSQKLLDKIVEFEGLKLTTYRCPAGIPTIGVGHTRGVKMGMRISREQAMSLLKGDVLPCEKYVNSLGLELTQSQFDALVDFCFNLGTGKLAGSTLLKKVRGKFPANEIQAEFKRWIFASGKVLPGLVKRREWEANCWTE